MPWQLLLGFLFSGLGAPIEGGRLPVGSPTEDNSARAESEEASQVESRMHAEKVEREQYAAESKELQRVQESEKTGLASATVEVQNMQTGLRLLRRQVLARFLAKDCEANDGDDEKAV